MEKRAVTTFISEICTMYIYLRVCFLCPHIPPLHRDAEGSHSAAYTGGNKQHVFPACNGNARRSVNCVNTQFEQVIMELRNHFTNCCDEEITDIISLCMKMYSSKKIEHVDLVLTAPHSFRVKTLKTRDTKSSTAKVNYYYLTLYVHIRIYIQYSLVD